MADIDMIPRSYRDGLRLRRALRRCGAALALVIVAAGAGHAALRWSSAAMQARSAALQAAATANQSALAHAATERDARLRALQHRQLLHAVRRPGELAALVQAIDATLPANAWLTAITLRRDLRLAQPADATVPANAIATGAADGSLLLQDSRVELAGQAASYDGVTGFLAGLGRTPGLQGVQLISSGASESAQAIDFRAALLLAPREAAQ